MIKKTLEEFDKEFPSMDTLHRNLLKAFLKKSLERQKKYYTDACEILIDRHRWEEKRLTLNKDRLETAINSSNNKKKILKAVLKLQTDQTKEDASYYESMGEIYTGDKK